VGSFAFLASETMEEFLELNTFQAKIFHVIDHIQVVIRAYRSLKKAHLEFCKQSLQDYLEIFPFLVFVYL